MTPPDETALKSCPFCGSKPITTESGEGGKGLMIECMGDNCPHPHVSYYDHASAIKVWNRRANLGPASDEDVERLTDIIQDAANDAADRGDEYCTRVMAAAAARAAIAAMPASDSPETLARKLRAFGWKVHSPQEATLPPVWPAIPWIRAYRAIHGVGLKEAKDAHDAALRDAQVFAAPPTGDVP